MIYTKAASIMRSYYKIQGLGENRVTKSFPSSFCRWKRHLDKHLNYTIATEGKSMFSNSRASELICIQMCLETLWKIKINSFSNWLLRCFTGRSATFWNLIFALIALMFPSKHIRNRWEKDTITVISTYRFSVNLRIWLCMPHPAAVNAMTSSLRGEL